MSQKRTTFQERLRKFYRYTFRDFRVPITHPDPSTNPFYLCRTKKFLFASIPKNACSTVKKLIIELDSGEEFNRAIHYYWRRERNADRLISPEQLNEKRFDDHIRFAIYRDPIARFLACYKNKILDTVGTPHIYRHYGVIHTNIDTFIDFLEWYFDQPWGGNEGHVAPQSKFFNLSDLDYLVDIDSLGEFFSEKFDVPTVPVLNPSNSDTIELTTKQQKRIRRLYHSDYAIKPNYPNPD